MEKKIMNFYSINKINAARVFYFKERVIGTHVYGKRNNNVATITRM